MPYTDASLPFSGTISASRHASWTGAQAAQVRRRGTTARYLALLRAEGPLSDHEAARRLKCGLSSLCSIRNGIRALLEPAGFDTAEFGGRVTRRTKWRIR